jgi:uncharacterized integral membrane protein (TIGR00698 family)
VREYLKCNKKGYILLFHPLRGMSGLHLRSFALSGFSLNTLKGLSFVAVFAALATAIASFDIFKQFQISPLIIGMVFGIACANTVRHLIPHDFESGIKFSGKMVLRAAIVFYGFRLTFQDIEAVGLSGILISFLMVTLTFVLGYVFGTRVLKLDRETTILTCSGASICGAAAVLATESVLKAPPHKSMVAVATVVLFGTIAMFLYPALYRAGLIPMTPEDMGVFIGASVHEVAHVVAAGNAIGPEASNTAVIIKMIRVLFLAPFLIAIGAWIALSAVSAASGNEGEKQKHKILIPWFAVLFIAVAGFNSFHLLPPETVSLIGVLDTFALTMAMTALGLETHVNKFKGVGMGPVYLALFLFIWLIFGGFAITKASLGMLG